jgi:hypothetical protein
MIAMAQPARTPEQRRRDALHRLSHDEDAWVATAGDAGPYLVPLSFIWDGGTLLFGTLASSPTVLNLRANGRLRLAVGPTRDLVMIEGTAEVLSTSAISSDTGDAFARLGFDPRSLSGYVYFRVRPLRVQAWREANEIKGRDLMRDGDWIVPG